MFPEFNIHSTPLLILVLQGLIFAVLLFIRYQKQRMIADAFMGLLLLVMAYHRTAYTIGFMGWYDTFTNTKINYYLLSLGLALGPLIYLYVRTTLAAPFKFHKTDWWHFIPIGVFLLYRLVIFLHDVQQEDWAIGYEGDWQRNFHLTYMAPIQNLLEYSSQLLYLAFTIQLFGQYRAKIKQFFSNTYKLELNWLLLFLAVFCFLFVYGSMTDLVDAFITELHYTHRWWVHFFSAIAIVLLGMKAYFTDLQGFQLLTYDIREAAPVVEVNTKDYSSEMATIQSYINDQQPYLNPDFNLKDLANGVGWSIHQASEVINNGFGINFNEFINRHRVEEAQRRLHDPQYDHLTIIAIGFDSGFNSKATFNRVFKQVSGLSPSQYKQSKST